MGPVTLGLGVQDMKYGVHETLQNEKPCHTEIQNCLRFLTDNMGEIAALAAVGNYG